VDTVPSQPPTQDIDTIIQQALDNRPDLKALELQQSAAEHLTTAEERLQLPDINALGVTGVTPAASSRLGTNAYGAVGINIHIPVFNGFLFRRSHTKQALSPISQTGHHPPGPMSQLGISTYIFDTGLSQTEGNEVIFILDRSFLLPWPTSACECSRSVLEGEFLPQRLRG
jgi:hypothetical protein